MQTHKTARWLALVVVLGMAGRQSLAQSTSVERNTGQRRVAGELVSSERDEQAALFDFYFRERSLEYETRLENLPRKAAVPAWRVPYSAAIHPETAGGMSDAGGVRPAALFARRRRPATAARGSGTSALSVYDRAFNGGQGLANSYEARRITGGDQAVFRFFRPRSTSESWEGYCSGFTASTIRHPEPVRAVDAGQVGGTPGVILRPADIKALLSCIYNRTTDDSYLYLAPPSARDGGPNMGTFHLALTNYIGRADHPVGIDRTKGQVAWNNPIYAYQVNSVRDSGTGDGLRYKDVETTVTYTSYGSDADQQTDLGRGEVVGNRKQSMTFRYTLALDDEGTIVGGRARSGSGHFLWIPLYPVQATRDGTVPGNPYVDAKKVLALAEASADPAVRAKFAAATIGPQTDPQEEPEPSDSGEDGDGQDS